MGSDPGLGKGERTRTAIVEQAVMMASQVGLEALSIGGLAKALSLSKSGLFAHFQSKENLQLKVLEAAGDKFVGHVVRPAMQEPRGEPRVRALVVRWLDWADSGCPGGCVFASAAFELDDRPGPVRDAVVYAQEQWQQTLARAARISMDEEHFRADLDPRQFAFDVYAVMLGYHHAARLLEDPDAKPRTLDAVERLIDSARTH